jgi:hypothetical protein
MVFVRPGGRHISMVKVHVGVRHSPVVERNCVVESNANRQRLNTGWEATGDEVPVRRMTNSIRRDVAASLRAHGEALKQPYTLKCLTKRCRGTYCGWRRNGMKVWRSNRGYPSVGRGVMEVRVLIVSCFGRGNRVMEPILWHRRETRRQTEKTNRLLPLVDSLGRKMREPKPHRGKGGRKVDAGGLS